MANLGDFMRKELAAIRAMGELQRSLTGSLALPLPKFTLPQDFLGEAGIQAMMRNALAENRLADVAARLATPSWSASGSVASLLGSLRPGRELAEQAVAMHKTWRSHLPFDQLRLANFPPPALGAHLASISRLAETSRLLTGLIPPDSIGRALAVSAEARGALSACFDRLSAACGAFYKEVGESEKAVLALPPALTARPVVEYFAAADLAEATTGTEVDPEAGEELDATRSQVAAENSEALRSSLTHRFPDLLVLVQGARAAFASKHADYARHVTTSLRELFTHVLHRLAPDEDVKKFSTNADDFPSGKPTRAVRLRYICREVNSGRFTDFVKKDVAAMLAFVDLFQGGTHEVTSSYTPAQLRALLVRTEGIVRFLLEINEAEQGRL